MKRPGSITLIGWLATGFGGLMVLFSPLQLIAPYPSAEALLSGPERPVFVFAAFFADNLPLVAVGSVIVGATAMAGGVGLLRLRAWGRALVEAITWLYLAYCLAFTAFAVWGIHSESTRQGGSGDGFEVIAGIFAIVIGLGGLAWCLVPLLVLRALRGEKVRAAISANQGRTP
ncbi:MAG: hypothetical protein P1V51_16200 [Deltaproteobacteria bacterium]|nr:hypothetical protein [Deltaproteobacteria bacterium]